MYIYIYFICIFYVYTAHTDSAYIISETQSTPTKHTGPHYWTQTPQNLAHNQCCFPKIEPKNKLGGSGSWSMTLIIIHCHQSSIIYIPQQATGCTGWCLQPPAHPKNRGHLMYIIGLCMDRYRYRII